MAVNNRPEGVLGAKNKGYPAFKPGAVQKIAFTGTNSTATATNSTLLKLVSLSSACHINIGSTATDSSDPVPPGVAYFIRVDTGDQLNVISSGTDGNLFITEML